MKLKIKNMNFVKNLFKIGLMLMFIFGGLNFVVAQQAGQSAGGGQFLQNPLGGAGTLEGFLLSLMRGVRNLVLVVAVFFIILSGFQFLTAQGNETKIAGAKKNLTWTLIGVAIVLGAEVLIEAIIDLLKDLG